MRSACFVLTAFWLLVSLPASSAVTTVTPVAKVTADGVEPAEWQLTDGWSIVTNKMGVGKLYTSSHHAVSLTTSHLRPTRFRTLLHRVSFPSGNTFLAMADGASRPSSKTLAEALYASCDICYSGSTNTGKTPSTVWLGTDTHAGLPLAGVKLNQIRKMKYYAFVSGVPTLLASGVYDSNWSSWQGWWYNPRFPIQLQLCFQDAQGNRKQVWYRPWGNDPFIGDNCSDGRLSIWEQYSCMQYGRWLCPPDYDGYALLDLRNLERRLGCVRRLYSCVHLHKLGPWHWPVEEPGLEGQHSACWAAGRHGHRQVPEFRGRRQVPDLGYRSSRLPRPDGLVRAGRRPQFGWRCSGCRRIGHLQFRAAAKRPRPCSCAVESEGFGLGPGSFDNATRGARGQVHNLAANPLRDNKEDRIYDIMFKLSGSVTEQANALFHINDGTNLSLLDVRKMLYKRWEPATPSLPMAVGQHWSTWGLLERFRATGKIDDTHPATAKPFLVWTAKSHNMRPAD